ncbi:MAG: hypothetical protein IJ525_06670 [Alphaproteobacteria bacterium]|nr:hypothetical protein [Alphaproteobacteria bacterium]
MGNFSGDFLDYLAAKGEGNDFYLAQSPDLKDEEIARLTAKYSYKYEVWLSVPGIIRQRYGNDVPQEILDAAARGEVQTLREMEQHPEIKRVEDARAAVAEKYSMPADIINDMAAAVFIAAASAGYSLHAAHELAQQRQFRESLRDKALNNTMTDEEKQAWRESRIKTRDIIKKDLMENQPEKYLLHLLAKYNRGHISKDDLMPQVADLVQRIETNGRQDKLLNLLKNQRVSRRMQHFKPETLDILSSSVLAKVPQDERDNILSRIPRKAKIFENMSDEQKSKFLSQEMRQANSNVQRTLSSDSIRENMPSVMRQQNVRSM